MNHIALYTTAEIPAEQLARIQAAFDTAEDYPGPGHIVPVAPLAAAHGLAPAQVDARHWAALPAGCAGSPLVVLDARTRDDDTVLVVAAKPHPSDPGAGDARLDDFELPESEGEPGSRSGLLGVRFIPRAVPATVVNLQIGNQDLSSYIHSIDEDGVWRQFRRRRE